MLNIPKYEPPKDTRQIGYILRWKDRYKKKKINYDELDETEIQEIEEFELDIIKGKEYKSKLLRSIEKVIELYESIDHSKTQDGITIYSYYINTDNTIQVKRMENYYELKETLK